MRQVGIGPTASVLSGRRSTTELLAQCGDSTKKAIDMHTKRRLSPALQDSRRSLSERNHVSTLVRIVLRGLGCSLSRIGATVRERLRVEYRFASPAPGYGAAFADCDARTSTTFAAHPCMNHFFPSLGVLVVLSLDKPAVTDAEPPRRQQDSDEFEHGLTSIFPPHSITCQAR